MIKHRLYKNGELTRAGENFAIDQQERLEAFSEEQKEQELSKVFINLASDLGEHDANTVLSAIKEFMADVAAVLTNLFKLIPQINLIWS